MENDKNTESSVHFKSTLLWPQNESCRLPTHNIQYLLTGNVVASFEDLFFCHIKLRDPAQIICTALGISPPETLIVATDDITLIFSLFFLALYSDSNE